MRLGMFMMPVHPASRSFTETLAEDEEKSLYADRLGFDELWLGEHFSATTEPIPSPLMFMAGLVPRTKNLTFGTAVICLPNHHPVVVAAEVAQFDHMSRGRFMLGIGQGGLLSDFELFDNADRELRARKARESISIIQRIWAQDPPYDIEGEFWNVSIKDAIIPSLGIGYMPKPFREGGPPISMSVASRNSPTARVAGLQGWGIITGNNVPLSAIASHWQMYSKASAEAGKTPCGENWRVSRNIMVAPSDAEARDRVFGEQGSNHYFFTYMREVLSRVGILSALKPRVDMSDDEATVEVITEGNVIYGSAKTVLDRLVALRDDVGPFGSLLMTGLDWGGPNGAWERDSMRLLADEVMPKFRQHAQAQAAE
ncbi:MAG: LLM class flavin-dependent oxidoreductase [Xanthobacteraceae bacterium]|jgi:alkanesulfonate monooxygenase SsuD/methylene tetrahydromethanopterin reductase-like flavin-dependent oxidoreductase (luciferase family)